MLMLNSFNVMHEFESVVSRIKLNCSGRLKDLLNTDDVSLIAGIKLEPDHIKESNSSAFNT